jgi:hypothetical protein
VNGIDPFDFYQIENQIIEVVGVVHVKVDGSVKDPVMPVKVDGPHADVQLFGDGIGNGVVDPEPVPTVQLDPGQIGEYFVLCPFGSHQFIPMA